MWCQSHLIPERFKQLNWPDSDTLFRSNGRNAYTVLSGWQHRILRLGHTYSLERYKRLHCIIWLAASNSLTRSYSFAQMVQTLTLYIRLAVSDSPTKTSSCLGLPVFYTLCFSFVIISGDILNKFPFSRYMYRL